MRSPSSSTFVLSAVVIALVIIITAGNGFISQARPLRSSSSFNNDDPKFPPSPNYSSSSSPSEKGTVKKDQDSGHPSASTIGVLSDFKKSISAFFKRCVELKPKYIKVKRFGINWWVLDDSNMTNLQRLILGCLASAFLFLLVHPLHLAVNWLTGYCFPAYRRYFVKEGSLLTEVRRPLSKKL